MNRQELRLAVVDATGRRDKASQINTAITLGFKRLGMEHQARAQLHAVDVTTVDGTGYTALPSETFQVQHVRRVEGTLTEVVPIWPRARVLKEIPDPASQPEGRPRVAYELDSKLYWVPVPDAAYTMNLLVVRLDTLEADATENPFPGSDEAIIAFAASWIFSSLEQLESAQFWEAKWQMAQRTWARGERKKVGTVRKAEWWGDRPDEGPSSQYPFRYTGRDTESRL
jgi:hypothetical protein